jgi:copper(I)-binding protein
MRVFSGNLFNLAAAALLAFAFGSNAGAGEIIHKEAAHKGSSIEVVDPYLRANIPGTTNGVAFMVLKNHGDQDVFLTGVKSEIANKIELHTTLHEGEKNRMREVSKIKVPKGASAALESGHFHVMLIGLKRDLKVGEKVGLKLEFSNGETLSIEAPVKKVSDAPMANMPMGNKEAKMPSK